MHVMGRGSDSHRENQTIPGTNGTSVTEAAMAGFAPDTGTSVARGSVFIKNAGDPRARFAPIDIFASDAVGHLAERASLKFDWRTSATYVELFLVPVGMVRDVQRDLAREADVLVDTNRCLATDVLAEAGILDRSSLLARLTDPPAAALGESVLETVSLLSCSSSWRPEGLAGVIPLWLGAPPPSLSSLSHPIAGGSGAGAGA